MDNIQGKYSFRERPQESIVVKASGGSRIDLSADNFIGIIRSYVYLAKVGNSPGLSVEWVREDSIAIQKNLGRFPSLPGVYFMEITSEGEFYVDPLLDVYSEPVTMLDTLTGQLQQPPLSGTLRLFEMPANYQLVEGTNYTLTLDPSGNPTGEIILTNPLTGGRSLSADYRYPGTSTGPHEYQDGFANNRAIPGVVLAFGPRTEVGDKMAVVVQDMRRPAAMAYGGHWELNLEIEITTRDLYSQEEIADRTTIWMWSILRPALSSEGIEITDVSLGGESEEPYDDNGDDYFYSASLSVTARTAWEVHVPLNIYLRNAAFLTVEQAQVAAGLDDEAVATLENNLKLVESLGLQSVEDPFFKDKTKNYEVIR